MLRKVLDKILQRLVGHLRLVCPRGIPEDAIQALRVGRLNGAEGIEQCPAHVAGSTADVVPMRAFRNREAIVRSRASISGVCRLAQGSPVFLVPHVRQALEKEQREDVLLVVAGIDQAPQELRGAPEVGLKFLLAHVFSRRTHPSQPPSVRTLRRRSSARSAFRERLLEGRDRLG